MKNILVTGGAGYIGSHTVVELAAAGYNPVIIDDFSNSKHSVIGNIEKLIGQKVKLYEGKFQDKKLLARVFGKEKIEGIIHFAAFKTVGESVDEPLKYYSNNVVGLVKLLEAVEEHSISNFVFSSSCIVYGDADKLPVTEKSIIKPATSPYGATKQIDEMIIHDVSNASKNLRSLALRYFNPIGAHPSGLIGQMPIGPPSILVPFITQTAAGWHSELVVFGNDYPTTDGTNIRDYIHVVDLAKAHVKAVEYISRQKPTFYDVINIGTGKGSSVLEAIKTFEKVTGLKLSYRIGPRRPGDIIASFAAVDKANKVLDWSAEKTLADALSDAWRWQQTLKRPND